MQPGFTFQCNINFHCYCVRRAAGFRTLLSVLSVRTLLSVQKTCHSVAVASDHGRMGRTRDGVQIFVVNEGFTSKNIRKKRYRLNSSSSCWSIIKIRNEDDDFFSRSLTLLTFQSQTQTHLRSKEVKEDESERVSSPSSPLSRDGAR